MKQGYFVEAAKGSTAVKLPAPRGESEAYAMAGHLKDFGWGHFFELDESGARTNELVGEPTVVVEEISDDDRRFFRR